MCVTRACVLLLVPIMFPLMPQKLRAMGDNLLVGSQQMLLPSCLHASRCPWNFCKLRAIMWRSSQPSLRFEMFLSGLFWLKIVTRPQAVVLLRKGWITNTLLNIALWFQISLMLSLSLVRLCLVMFILVFVCSFSKSHWRKSGRWEGPSLHQKRLKPFLAVFQRYWKSTHTSGYAHLFYLKK